MDDSDQDELIPVFMPHLSNLLMFHEKKNNAPLTKEEVIAIRDSAVVIALRRSVAE